jgi:pimeloyl-ACP methyl ester carboxylesterase
MLMSMQPTHRRVAVNGITLSVFEWQRDQGARHATILLAHATGFHARCWDRVVAHLGARHVVAVDQRGHGRSDKTFPVHWQDFGRDLAELLRVLDLTDVIGVGHSMGGHAMTEAAAAEPQRFARLLLIDPVIASPEEYAAATPHAAWLNGQAHPTAKRRNRWASPDEMFERFKERPPFSTWDRDVLRDYCTYGLLPDPNGEGFVLACPPEFEAAVYMASRGNAGVHASGRAVDVPVLVVRAMEPPPDRDWMDFRYSPTWPGLANQFRRGRELYLPDQTHFLPMEQPQLVAKLIEAEASDQPFAGSDGPARR